MGKRMEFLNIVSPPRAGQPWLDYLRRLQAEFEHERQERGDFGFQTVFRFSYEMARECARDESMRPVYAYMLPDDFEGWFPKRMFGCLVFREAWPGALFKEYRGMFEGSVPLLETHIGYTAPLSEKERQQRIGGG